MTLELLGALVDLLWSLAPAVPTFISRRVVVARECGVSESEVIASRKNGVAGAQGGGLISFSGYNRGITG
jgi:hypothetical protein